MVSLFFPLIRSCHIIRNWSFWDCQTGLGFSDWILILNAISLSCRFDYPQPTFQKLMKEHCMEPFFVFQVISTQSFLSLSLSLSISYSQSSFYLFLFCSSLLCYLLCHPCMQVFCVGLWCLDEYWYYSLFTLFMLFMFESTMAKSRLKTLTELRRVRVDGQTLMAYRCGKYVIFMSITWFFNCKINKFIFRFFHRCVYLCEHLFLQMG